MATAEISSDLIHVVLSSLIAEKAKRDKMNFTSGQLASALNVPRSTILRLIHNDPTKRYTNPKIETLIKIVDFFRSDGFDITIDDLLGTRQAAIFLCDQKKKTASLECTIPLFSLKYPLSSKLGMIDIKLLDNPGNNLIAFQSDTDIKPIFKKGSIFIVDQDAELENDTLVALRQNDSKKILIRKCLKDKKQIVFTSYDTADDPIFLNPSQMGVIGVIIQINVVTK